MTFTPLASPAPAAPAAGPAGEPAHRRPAPRSLAAALAALLGLGLAAALVGAAPAAAQGEGEGGAVTGYQFWGYYQAQDGEWAFATEGAGATNPEDGSVEGWRFAAVASDDARFPRATATFEELCADQPEAAGGDKRVGVVVDPGRPADAPEGEQPPEPSGHCAVVPADATGLEVLQAAVGEVRTDADGGMVCGVQGFPESGCGDPVDQLTEEQQAPDEPVELAVAGTADQGAGEDQVGATTQAPAGDDAGTPEQTGEEQADEEGAAWWAWALVVLGALVLLGLVLRARSRSSATD